MNICPKCNKEYKERPAMSRVDCTPICADCGIREALETIGVLPEEQEKIIHIIHSATGDNSCESKPL